MGDPRPTDIQLPPTQPIDLSWLVAEAVRQDAPDPAVPSSRLK